MCENHATSKGNGEDLAYFRIAHKNEAAGAAAAAVVAGE
jgi:hypothetical protein